MSTILTAFNNHFLEFLTDIQGVFPNNVDILTAKNGLIAIRKTNPKLIIKYWYNYICIKYSEEIKNGDFTFFINKDYTEDLTDADSSSKIIEAINRLKEPVTLMTTEDKDKVMKYVQNLSKLASLYEING